MVTKQIEIDLMTRLRSCAECEQAPLGPLLTDAADEIGRLRAEVAALRGAVSELSRDRLALTGKLTVERVEGNKLRAKIERMRVNRDAALSMCRSSAEQLKRHNDAVAEVAALRAALHEIAEEWAGAECGEPVHAQEAYAIALAKRMYRLAADALAKEGK